MGQQINWKERDQKIVERAEVHVVGIDHLLDLFPSKVKAYQRIAKLRETKKLRHVGMVQMGNGRPKDLYCNGWYPERDKMEHEFHLTTFALCYPECDFIRGPLTDRKLKPDAEMFLDDCKYFIEYDTGTVHNRAKLIKRFAVYSEVENEILWVSTTKERSDKIRSICNEEDHWFTDLEKVRCDPWGEIWTDYSGETGSIEKGV